MENKLRLLEVGAYGILGGWAYWLVGCGQWARADFGFWLGLWLGLWIYAGLGGLMLWRGRWGLAGLVAAGLAWRLAWWDSLPILSDDFWRFIIDGRLWLAGENPFLYRPMDVPAALAERIGLASLRAGCNSMQYYSVYPLLSQLWFGAAVKMGAGQVAAEVFYLRLQLIFGEIFLWWGLYKLLNNKKLLVLWLLSPFVIIEGAGNLHFEFMQLAFLVWGLYFYERGRWVGAGVLVAGAAACKLLPLLLMPILVFGLAGWGRRIGFGLLVMGIVGLSFWPFLRGGALGHIGESLHLYVGRFEFNASIYYILRELGYWWYDMNMIATWGKLLYIAVFLWVWYLAIFRRGWWLRRQAFWAVAGYYLAATTVHPWYVANIFLLGLLAGYWRLGLAWSVLVFLSYSAYAGAGERAAWLWLEYGGLSVLALLFCRNQNLQNFRIWAD